MTTTRSGKRESDLQKQVIKWCRENGVYCVNVHAGGMTGKGTPDVLICLDGKFVGCELKVKGNKMDAAQEIRRCQILESGGYHILPYSFPEFLQAIEDIRNEKS